MSELNQKWICIDLKLLDEGKSIEATFESTTSKHSRITCCYSADCWLAGTWAEFKLAQFRESLKDSIDILQGRK